VLALLAGLTSLPHRGGQNISQLADGGGGPAGQTAD
jgi:hypothetical protein